MCATCWKVFTVLVVCYINVTTPSKIILVEEARACFRRLLVGRRVNEQHIRRSLPANSLEACQEECAVEEKFTCEGFNFRADKGTGRGSCELTGDPYSLMDPMKDFMDDRDFEFYERDRSVAYDCNTGGNLYAHAHPYGPWENNKHPPGPWQYGLGGPGSARPTGHGEPGPNHGGHGHGHGGPGPGHGGPGHGGPGNGGPGPGHGGPGHGEPGPGHGGPGHGGPGHGHGGPGPGHGGPGHAGPGYGGPGHGHYGGGQAGHGLYGAPGQQGGGRPQGQYLPGDNSIQGGQVGFYGGGGGQQGSHPSSGHGGNRPHPPGQYPPSGGHGAPPSGHGQYPHSAGGHGQYPPSGGGHGQYPPSGGGQGQYPPSGGGHGQYPPSGGGQGQYPPSGNGGYRPPPPGPPPPPGGPGQPYLPPVGGGRPPPPTGAGPGTPYLPPLGGNRPPTQYPPSGGNAPPTGVGHYGGNQLTSVGHYGGHHQRPGGHSGGVHGHHGPPGGQMPPSAPGPMMPDPNAVGPYRPGGGPPCVSCEEGMVTPPPDGVMQGCFLRVRTGFRLDRLVVQHSLNAESIRACEEECTSGTKLLCKTFSYRYVPKPSQPAENCLLSTRAYKDLDPYSDFVPEKEYDIYEKNTHTKTCMSYPPPMERPSNAGTECFMRVRTGQRLVPTKVKMMTDCQSLGECELECLRSKRFTCRMFSFRYGSPIVGGPEENCELSDWHFADLDPRMDLISDLSYTLYERGSYGQGCMFNQPHKNKPSRRPSGTRRPGKPSRRPPPMMMMEPWMEEGPTGPSGGGGGMMTWQGGFMEGSGPAMRPQSGQYGPDSRPQGEKGKYPPSQGQSQGYLPPQGGQYPSQGQSQGQYPPNQGQNQGYLPPPGQGQSQGYLPPRGGPYPTQGQNQGHYPPPQGQNQGQYPSPHGQNQGQYPPPRGQGQNQYPPPQYGQNQNYYPTQHGQQPPPGQRPPPYGPIQGQYYPPRGQSQMQLPPPPGVQPGPPLQPPPTPLPRPPDALCYKGIGKPAKLMPSAVRSGVAVMNEEACKAACTRAREEYQFHCASFSYQEVKRRDEGHNCMLSDIAERDLKPGVDYVEVEGSWLFSWNVMEPRCDIKDNGQQYPGNNFYPGRDDASTWQKFTVSGRPCRRGTQCAENPVAGFWACPLEGGDADSWDYCCRPGHQCGFSEGYNYPWCYVGSAAKDQWRPCSQHYYPNMGQGHNASYGGSPGQSHGGPPARHPGPQPGGPGYPVPTQGGFPASTQGAPVMMNPGGIPGMSEANTDYGPPRYWPVSYLHKEGPGNMTLPDKPPTGKSSILKLAEKPQRGEAAAKGESTPRYPDGDALSSTPRFTDNAVKFERTTQEKKQSRERSLSFRIDQDELERERARLPRPDESLDNYLENTRTVPSKKVLYTPNSTRSPAVSNDVPQEKTRKENSRESSSRKERLPTFEVVDEILEVPTVPRSKHSVRSSKHNNGTSREGTRSRGHGPRKRMMARNRSKIAEVTTAASAVQRDAVQRDAFKSWNWSKDGRESTTSRMGRIEFVKRKISQKNGNRTVATTTTTTTTAPTQE